uniref:Uncharacterized protein n=1 Tax=Rhizophora mucronata TaxID=61149 RepID=A0A2P2KUB6_RHIMU
MAPPKGKDLLVHRPLSYKFYIWHVWIAWNLKMAADFSCSCTLSFCFFISFEGFSLFFVL